MDAILLTYDVFDLVHAAFDWAIVAFHKELHTTFSALHQSAANVWRVDERMVAVSMAVLSAAYGIFVDAKDK